MSEITPFEVVPYLEEARPRYTEQFKNKEVFDKYIQLLIYGQEQLQLVFQDLIQKRSLDTAGGEQLNLIGELVGLPRGSLPSAAWEGSYFGFESDPDALGFADLDVETISGIFFDQSSATEGNVAWTDEVYRLFLKAKIFANSSTGTPEELILATKSILNVDYVDIVETGNANLLISFNRLLTDVEKYILQGLGDQQGLLPIPIGVGVGYIESPEEFFGFDETPGALGFASFEEVPTGTGGFGEMYGEMYGGGSGGTATVLVGGGYFASLF